MFPRRRVACVVRAATALTVVAVVGGCRSQATPRPAGTADIEAVIDGDTVVVRLNGKSEHARLIGINTPETVDRNKPVECHGPEASALTKELLPKGTTVRLERDVEARDTYGRLLVYVYRSNDNLFVNREIALRGEAYELSIAPNTTRAADISRAVDEARSAGRGLWSSCPAR
jgi:micrococcal nuclease